MAEYLIEVQKNATLDSVEDYYNRLYQAIELDLTIDVFFAESIFSKTILA